ncbi:MAG: cytochrome c oxidase assembly protein [Deltaproteobacteria bacterium]|nr:cytochrome c oxidase assembly protein [Deltaproteobacteria bacterium]
MSRSITQLTPYCGSPPNPADLWFHWNIDPLLITILLLLLVAYYGGAVRDRDAESVSFHQKLLFGFGWVLVTVALISPLCPLSVSLFSARIAQHMVLTLIAAPAIALAEPVHAYSRLLKWNRRSRMHNRGGAAPLLAAGLFAIVMWGWHSPYLYLATFRSTVVYWLMHITLFGTAVWLWVLLLDMRSGNSLRTIGASIVCTIQMGFLGAVLLFARHPLYSPHFLTTAVWGLTPLQDQQLGAVILWAPGCTIFLAASVVSLWRVLDREDWAGASMLDGTGRLVDES